MITPIGCPLTEPFTTHYIFSWNNILCHTLADTNAAVSSARRVTSRTYYKLAGLGIWEMIRLSSFLLSGTCLFCNTVLWVGDSNRTCRSNSVPQHCWSAFYWFFICSILEFLVGFWNGGAKGCTGGVLIRNALVSPKSCELFCCFWAWLYHIHKTGFFHYGKKVLLCEAKSEE